jgi:chromosome segregation ATPase
MLKNLTKDEVALFIKHGSTDMNISSEDMAKVINNLSVSNNYIYQALQNIEEGFSETADNISNLRSEVESKVNELEEYESHLEKSRAELDNLINFWLMSTKPSN